VAVNKIICIFISQGNVYPLFYNLAKHKTEELPKCMSKAEISEEKFKRTVNKKTALL
jgi:hypothetical protein